jgi:hypothetical protein
VQDGNAHLRPNHSHHQFAIHSASHGMQDPHKPESTTLIQVREEKS